MRLAGAAGMGGAAAGGRAGWAGVTLLLCAFGLLREIRPSEPYVSEFILGEWRNITEAELNQQVYPVGTYSYLAQLVLVFLLTDYLRFKPVILLSGICGIIVYAILLWTASLEWLQVTQFFYGLYMATEVAYLTYIFAKVDSSKYSRVSSYTRMAALAGRFLSGSSAQLLTYFGLMDYRQLIYITFTAQILATFWAIFLPPVKFSVYFHRNKPTESAEQTDVSLGIQNTESAELKEPAARSRLSGKPNDVSDVADETSREVFTQDANEYPGCSEQFIEASSLIARHARAAYSRWKVVRWSVLYAVSICLFSQAQSYVQLLWMNLQPDVDVAYNGAVEAVLTLLGAGGAFLSSRLAHGSLPGLLAIVQAAALFSATFPGNIYLSYAGYVLVGVCFHYTITLASTKIASELSDESCFGLIFGINTLAGTALQSLLTFVMISDAALGLPIRGQFYTISGCYLVLAACWMCGWVVKTVSSSEKYAASET